jgi:hypothetical protein
MKKYLLFLSLFLTSLSLWANEPSVKTYTAEECARLGLKPYIMPDGSVIMPQHDGERYFVDLGTNPSQPADISPDQVRAFFEKVRSAGNVVNSFLNLQYASKLPVVIGKEIQGTRYEVGLDKLVFTPQGNTISVYAMITTQSNQHICFAGENIGFTGQGGIQEGVLRILLGGDSELKLLKLDKIKLNITEGSLKFGCDGYESFSLAGKIIFDRELIVPEDKNSGEVQGGNVTSTFKLDNVADWNDLLIEIDMPTFQIPKMEGYSFLVENAVFDISDATNGSTNFPVGYTSAEMGPQWHGVYIGEISVRFPESFKNRTTNQRLKVGVKNLLIDNIGVSGEIFGENIMVLKDGDLNGWDYSLDYAGIEVVKNKVRSGKLEGKLRVSVSEEEYPFGYKAVIDPMRDYYKFSVASVDKLEFEFLKAANVTLAPNSEITLELISKKFVASAMLHGKMDITAKDEGVALQSYSFEKFFVSTSAPYLSIGHFGGGSDKEQKLGNFPVSLIAPTVLVQNNAAMVKFGLKVNLDNVGITAMGGFVVEGAFVNENNRHFWRHKRIAIEKLSVAGDFKVGKINGTIAFFKNDPIYGKGFAGELGMDMKVAKDFQFNVAAIFGRTEDKPYWYLDGEYSGGGGSGLSIHLLAGGFYKHMRASGQPGAFKTSTGIGYVPDFGIGWGAKFGVGFGVGGGKAISGMAGMEVVTRADGSLAKVGLMGRVAFAGSDDNHSPQAARAAYIAMTSSFAGEGSLANQTGGDPMAVSGAVNSFIPETGNDKVGFSAFCVLNLDFANDTYFGKAGASVQAKAIGIRATAEFLFGPDKWYIHFGKPPLSERIGVTFSGFMKADAYIMVGHGVVDMPDPQPNIFDKFPGERAGYSTGVSSGTINMGQGIALGAAIGVQSSGDFLILSYDVGGRAGTDVMLTRYADGVYCIGREGQGIGINNWRAGGQMYVIGWFKAKAFRINVLDISLGAMLRAKAPNPTYATGKVQANFRVLFKTFKFKVGFSVGEDCELSEGEGTEEIAEVIESHYPLDGATYVSTDKKVSFSFIEPIEKEIRLEGMDSPLLIKVIDFVIKDGQGNTVPGSFHKENDKKIVFKTSEAYLPADQKLTASVRIQVYANGQPMMIDGAPLEQTKSFSFTTAKSAQQHVDELEEVKKDIHEQAQNIRDEAQQEADQINREAEERAEEIRKRSEEAIKEIEKKNEERAEEIRRLAESSPPEIQKKVDSVVSDALDQTKIVIDDSREKIKGILDGALAEVRQVTSNALNDVNNVVAGAESRAINHITTGQQQIMAMAIAYNAAVRALEKERKQKVFWKIFKSGKNKVREEYRIKALQMEKQHAIAVEAVRVEAERKAQGEMDAAKREKDRIMEAARVRCREIMDRAERECGEVIADAAAQCQAIMDEAERICRDIIGLPQVDSSVLNSYADRALAIYYNESDDEEGGEGLDEEEFERLQQEAETKKQQEEAARLAEEERKKQEEESVKKQVEDQMQQYQLDEETKRRINEEIARNFQITLQEENNQREQEAQRLENIRLENERAEQQRLEQQRQEEERLRIEREQQAEVDRQRQLDFDREQQERINSTIYYPPVINRDYMYPAMYVEQSMEMMY